MFEKAGRKVREVELFVRYLHQANLSPEQVEMTPSPPSAAASARSSLSSESRLAPEPLSVTTGRGGR